jgi:hypothetical protein
MRSLWVLAGALDAHADGHRYFRYLRTRYVQLSADVFGRDVSVVGPPVGSLRSQAPRPATTPANGAGRSAKPATAAAD